MSLHSAKVIELAREVLVQFGYFIDNLWHVDDVHFICEQLELPKISDENAKEVFRIAKEQFDGEVGISWPQLEEALKIYMQQKTILSTSLEANPA